MADLNIPDYFFSVPYNGAHYPGAAQVKGLEGGANCQQFAYELLRYFGYFVPNLRSSDLWQDTLYTNVVTDLQPLDLVLWNKTADAYGAHVGVYLGEGKVIHLSKEKGFAQIENLSTLQANPLYVVLIGAKRLKRTIAFLIRHAESTANAGQVSDSPATIPLTTQGQQQADQLAEQFEYAPHLVISSPFIRTLQTAIPTLKRFPSVAYDIWAIQEFTYLSPVACKHTTAAQRHPLVEAYWQRNDPAYVDGAGAESFNELIQRVKDFLQKLQNQYGLLYVFTHGQFMRATQLVLNHPELSTTQLMSIFRQQPAYKNTEILPLSFT